MSLQLHCTRSKIFIQSGERSVKCGRGETTNVPNWVRDTVGYKAGVKDKSIIDLTPGSGNSLPSSSDEVNALRKRVAELEAQVADLQAQRGVIPDEDDDPTGDKANGNGQPQDDTSVVDLSTAKSTVDASGEPAEGVSEPKPSKGTQLPPARGLQGGRKAK